MLTSDEQASSSALGPARVLALTRIVAGLTLAGSGDLRSAARLATLAPELATPPSGLGWLVHLQLPEPLAVALVWLTVFAALLGAVGVYTRLAFGVASGTLLVLLALLQRVGAVTHAHHLLWLAVLLSVSPCADVWSADAYFGARELRSRASYQLPLHFMRALLAAIYFFPGLHKLLGFLHGVEPGAWLASHVSWKWLQHGHAARLPFPLSPAVLTGLALGALAFELSMPLLITFRRTRPLALLAALSFHFATAWLLFIRFDSLLVMLVPLLDFGPAPARLPPQPPANKSLVLVGSILLAGACITGVLGETQLYPFACYPTFAEPAPASMPSAKVWLQHQGKNCALPQPSSNPEWVQAFRIVGAYGDTLTATRAEAYLRARLAQASNPNGCQLLPDTRLVLQAQQLSWDFRNSRPHVDSERLLYSVSLAALGMAPADGSSASSSPVR